MGSALSSVKYTPDGLPYYNLNDIKNLDKLDEGGYGTVMKGVGIVMQKTGFKPPDPEIVMKTYQPYGLGSLPTEVKKKRELAVKLFSKVDEYSEREIQILKMHSHPHIIELFGVIWNGKSEGSQYTGYVMEYMKLGSLHNEIHSSPKIYDLKLITTWIHQIAEGLQYLHENGIIHRDLKPKNILLAARDHLKLADFGLARNVSTRNTNTSGYIGTEVYRAPEVLNSRGYGPPADVYSFGVTIWEIVTRKHPGEHVQITTDEKGNMVFNVPFVEKIYEDVGNLIKRCVKANVFGRPTISSIRYYEPESTHTILILGGNIFDPTWVSINYYGMVILNNDRSKWIDLKIRPPCNTDGSGLVYLNGEIYIIGGRLNPKALYKIDKNLKWKQLADMNSERTRISNSCLEWNGFIWVFGGNYYEPKSVERYDPKENKWARMPDMRYPRLDAAATVWNDKIVVSGGYTIILECFNIEDGRWTDLPNMSKAYDGHSLLSYKGELIVMAMDTDKHTGMWAFNEKEGWRELPKRFRSYSSARIVLDKKIYVIGGRCSISSESIDRVEVFYGKHRLPGPTLPYKWCDMSAVVIPQSLADRLCSYKLPTPDS